MVAARQGWLALSLGATVTSGIVDDSQAREKRSEWGRGALEEKYGMVTFWGSRNGLRGDPGPWMTTVDVLSQVLPNPGKE